MRNQALITSWVVCASIVATGCGAAGPMPGEGPRDTPQIAAPTEPSSAPAPTSAPVDAAGTEEPPEAAPAPAEECGRGTTTPELTAAISGLAGTTGDCYLELRSALSSAGSKSHGEIDAQLAVAHDGTVRSVELTRDTLGSKAVADCVQDRFLRAKLPPTAEGCVAFKVPLRFSVGEE